MAAGFESWRTSVWASTAVIAIAEVVRRPRPSRLILPSLATQDVLVEGEELDQLEREVDALLAHATEVVEQIRPAYDMLDDFRGRLRNIKAAIQLARTVPRGAVEIA
jgi:hypothetical protein